MTKKKKDTYYIYYSLMKTLKLFCCKRELVLYRIILITRIDLYISENNERETCSRTVYSFTEASLSRKSSDFPAHESFYSTLSITIKWPPPPKHNNNKSLSCATATVARSSPWSIPKRHPTGRFSCRPRKTGNRCYATRNRAIG